VITEGIRRLRRLFELPSFDRLHSAATKGEKYHGELLLNGSQFLLVALLGFMPLIVIHFADQRPRVRLTRRTQHTILAAKAAMLVSVTNWIVTVVW
jgi:hypothetical protein